MTFKNMRNASTLLRFSSPTSSLTTLALPSIRTMRTSAS